MEEDKNMSARRENAIKQAKESFAIEAKAIMDILEYMDFKAFENAVELMSRCGRIATSGCGHSGIACMHFAHSLCCIERPARFISPSEALHGAMGFVHEGDVVLLASYGGKTEELAAVLKIANMKKATTITVTGNLHSPLAREAAIVLPMRVHRECDKFNSQSTSSFIVLSAILDALQVALIEETDYCNEKFAVIHPGGAVGERLNQNNSGGRS